MSEQESKKKRILVLHFSQTGQLSRILDSLTRPLCDSPDIELVSLKIEPEEAYAFPWPFFRFFNTFPETVALETVPIKALPLKDSELESFDLIILGYQVWFLSPSGPVTSLMKSGQAKKIFKDKPVVTVIGCRNMWLLAQEKMKNMLANLGARLIDNVALVDEAGSALSFFATPIWMLTGKKGPVGVFPRAGVSEENIDSASRFGRAILTSMLESPAVLESPMLTGLGAVKVNENLILSEKAARRSFEVWGKLIRSISKRHGGLRRYFIYLYVVYLVTLILTFVPITAVIKKLLSPLIRKRIQQQKAYYSLPSGEECYKMTGPKNG